MLSIADGALQCSSTACRKQEHSTADSWRFKRARASEQAAKATLHAVLLLRSQMSMLLLPTAPALCHTSLQPSKHQEPLGSHSAALCTASPGNKGYSLLYIAAHHPIWCWQGACWGLCAASRAWGMQRSLAHLLLRRHYCIGTALLSMQWGQQSWLCLLRAIHQKKAQKAFCR